MKLLMIVLSVLFSAMSFAAPKADLWGYWQGENSSSTVTVDHADWQSLLDTYLDTEHASGVYRFDYAAVNAAGKSRLDLYLQRLQQQDPRELNRAEQKAYWINLYNAVTVQAVLQAYPVTSVLKVGGGIFSRGPWNEKHLKVAAKTLSLNDIEHRILRPIWQDYRIHFAVNCASIGCPNLLPSAYTAENTEALLSQAAHDYLAHARGFERVGNTLKLSKIFDWYQSDFGKNEAELLNTLAMHLSPGAAATARSFKGKIEYHYDWSLNQP